MSIILLDPKLCIYSDHIFIHLIGMADFHYYPIFIDLIIRLIILKSTVKKIFLFFNFMLSANFLHIPLVLYCLHFWRNLIIHLYPYYVTFAKKENFRNECIYVCLQTKRLSQTIVLFSEFILRNFL